jgi:hypothetical protein
MWRDNGVPAAGQHGLFSRYNPGLMASLAKIADWRRTSMARSEVAALLSLKVDLVNRLLRRTRFVTSAGSDRQVPLARVFELLAYVMPVIENWETCTSLARRLEVSPESIRRYHRMSRMESRLVLAKIRISPIGASQVRAMVRSTRGHFEFANTTYYHPATIARLVLADWHGGSKDQSLYDRLVARYSYWMKTHKASLGVLVLGRRLAVPERVKDMMCDAVEPLEASRRLGLSRGRLRSLIRKGGVAAYRIGRMRWLSWNSCVLACGSQGAEG